MSQEEQPRLPIPPGTLEVSSGELSRIAFFSVLGGATSLIPLPVVDDWVWSFVRRRMVRDLLKDAGLHLGSSEVVLLAEGVPRKKPSGCLARALTMLVIAPISLVLYVLGRIFRKVFFLWAIKEATDRTSQVFHQGYLMVHARRTIELAGLVNRFGNQALYQLSYAIEETIRETDTSPLKALIRRSFRGSRWLLLKASRDLSRLARLQWKNQQPAPEELDQERQLLQRVWQGLTERIARETDYLDHLTRRFRHFATRRKLY